DRPRRRLAFPIGELFAGTLQQGDEGRRFMGLAGRQVEVQRVAAAVAEEVELGGEPAPRAAQGGVGGFLGIPFFPPPAAHLAARTTVPSMHHSSSSITPASTCAERSRDRISSSVPSPFHLSKRSQAVPQGPYSSGRSRQGAPVLKIQRIASTISRRSLGGRPVAAGAGNRSLIRSHSSSLSRCRGMVTSSTRRTR